MAGPGYTKEEDDMILAARSKSPPIAFNEIARLLHATTGRSCAGSAVYFRFRVLEGNPVPRSNASKRRGPPHPRGNPWAKGELDDLSQLILNSSDPNHPPWEEIGRALRAKGWDRSTPAARTKWHAIKPAHSISARGVVEQAPAVVTETSKQPPRAMGYPSWARQDKGKKRRSSTPATTSSQQSELALAPSSSMVISSSSHALMHCPDTSTLSGLLQRPPEGINSGSLLALLQSFESISKEHKAHFEAKGSELSLALTREYLVSGATLQQLEQFPQQLTSEIKALQVSARAGKQAVVGALMASLQAWAEE